jgi:hypothetical protein
LPETSALLPAETKLDIPTLSVRTVSRMASPSAPLCVNMPMLPAGGHVGAKVAFSATAGSVLRTPMQLGPTIRIPESRTSATRRRSLSRPAPEASPKPAEITTTARTPARAQSATAFSTPAAGTAITARSTGCPIAPTLG